MSQNMLTALISAMMEDPAVRDRRCHAHLRAAKANADNLKNEWGQPVKHDGFWRSSASNQQQQTHAKFSRATQSLTRIWKVPTTGGFFSFPSIHNFSDRNRCREGEGR